ncbi:GTP-binding protein [Rubritalea sp.]|uniref:GTP-binding protein n=1 Tax=Rubritalea sp. TaxID=2109375 RepID=UPI003EF8BAC5
MNTVYSVSKSGGDSMPAVVATRPMLMLTGFLGAGKTTLLRMVLDDLASRGYLADVILNDRENAGIDKEALNDHAASVSALTGSCVCCEGMDELYDMVLKASESEHKLLLVELNGTADPLPLLESFTLLESKFLLHPRWQVCVIDARYFGHRKRFRELEKLQLETATHYYLSHTACLNAQNEADLERWVNRVNPHATRASGFLLAHSLSEAIRQSRQYILAGRAVAQRVGKGEFSVEKAISPDLHDRHHLAHEFTGCSIIITEAVEHERVMAWMALLPESVIRVKALVIIMGDPDVRYLYERVGMVVSPKPYLVRSVSRVPCSGLFIGPDLQPDVLLQITHEHLHPDCHFPKK